MAVLPKTRIAGVFGTSKSGLECGIDTVNHTAIGHLITHKTFAIDSNKDSIAARSHTEQRKPAKESE